MPGNSDPYLKRINFENGILKVDAAFSLSLLSSSVSRQRQRLTRGGNVVTPWLQARASVLAAVRAFNIFKVEMR